MQFSNFPPAHKNQISLKAETEMAMKLLEKDIHEKQDTIVSLRRQLEDIKQINLEMYNKLQVRLAHQFAISAHWYTNAFGSLIFISFHFHSEFVVTVDFILFYFHIEKFCFKS